MFRLFLAVLLTLLICSCYRNEPSYSIQIGESLDLFVHTNSCCNYCWLDQENATHLRRTDRRVVDRADEDCAGCSNVEAWTYEGISEGTDTIRIATLQGGTACDEMDSSLIYGEVAYVIHVSK